MLKLYSDIFFDTFLDTATKSEFRPPVDIEEDDKATYVRVELPGVKAENTKITVEKNVLVIRGERKTTATSKYGVSFKRSFTLPTNVDVDGITAESEDGILTVTIPKAVEEKTREIKILTKSP